MNLTSLSRPAQVRSSGGISTREPLSISTSVALPMYTRRQPSLSIDSALSSASNFSHTGSGNSDRQWSGFLQMTMCPPTFSINSSRYRAGTVTRDFWSSVNTGPPRKLKEVT